MERRPRTIEPTRARQIAACLAVAAFSTTHPAVAFTSIAQHPAPRACFSAAALKDGAVFWGGARSCGVDVVRDSNLWIWNGAGWEAREGPPIEPRDDALMVHGPSRSTAKGALTLIGGRRAGQAFDDVWLHEDGVWSRLPSVGGPGPIQHGAAAFDPRRKRIVVFGGAVGRSVSAKTFEWDGTRWHEFDVPGPAPRVGHAMAWSRPDGAVLLYGGFDERQQYRDLWRWDGSGWKLLAAEGPTFTEGAVVTEAPKGIYIIGPGLDPASQTVRAWHWGGVGFVAKGTTKPPLRIGTSAVYDAFRGVVVLWGGSSTSGVPDSTLWEFDGTEWSARP